jgi:hypothetical protein
MSRPRGYAAWQPQAKTKELIDQVKGVLEEYRDYLPMTVRQVFYRLVGVYGYDKTEQAYERLAEHMNRARRAGLIDFDHIRDDGSTSYGPRYFFSLSDFWGEVGANARRYRRDRQAGQDCRIWLLCEAAGMAPMLAQSVAKYGVRVISSGGFDSLTAKHKLASSIIRHGEKAIILHVGDYDPSGVHLFNALAEDVTAMVGERQGPKVEFHRLAVTPEQIVELSLPTAPPKKTDRRAFDDTRTVQAEAIPPDVLSRIVGDGVRRFRYHPRLEVEWRGHRMRAIAADGTRSSSKSEIWRASRSAPGAPSPR